MYVVSSYVVERRNNESYEEVEWADFEAEVFKLDETNQARILSRVYGLSGEREAIEMIMGGHWYRIRVQECRD